MKKLEKLSGNELSESLALFHELRRVLKAYSHVSDNFPGLVSKVEKTLSDLASEYDRREEE